MGTSSVFAQPVTPRPPAPPIVGRTLTYSTAVRPGEDYFGYGVKQILDLSVNDGGEWVVHAETYHPDPTQNEVVIKNGQVVYQEGQVLPMPVGATLKIIDSVKINSLGIDAMNGTLGNTPGAPGDDNAIYVNGLLLAQEGTPVGALQFGAGTTYGNVFDIEFNDAGSVLVHGYFNDPTTAFFPDHAILRIDPLFGTEQAIARQGQFLPGNVTDTAWRFSNQPEDLALNNFGQAMFVVYFSDPSAKQALYLGDETGLVQLARQDGPSPVPGDPYHFFAASGSDLNDQGDHAFQAALQSGTHILVKNGELFIAEGDPLPRSPGLTLHDLGTYGPIQLDHDGNMLWVGTFGPGIPLNRDGLFLEHQLVVEEGVTVVAGRTIGGLDSGSSTGYALSDNGEWVLFEAGLQGFQGTGAFLVHLQQAPRRGPQG
jgi:hypothetical protein